MIINRNNYEEYFLLYIDRELSEAERKAVEHFVTENPDLRPELEALQSVTLDGTDTISFPGKKELLSTGSAYSIVNKDNCTDYFISYADNELNNTEKASVEQFVYHNPEHQQDFELFLQAKFEADQSVIFEDKKSLFRQEATVRPIAGWLKLSAAVAAAVIFLIFGYLQYNTDTDVEPGSLYSKNVTTEVKKDTAAGTKYVIPEPVLPGVNSTTPDNNIASKPVVDEITKTTPEIATAETPVKLKTPEVIQRVPETPEAAKPQEATDLTAEMDKASEVETDKMQSLHAGDLEIITQYAPEFAEQKQEAELSIANIPVSDKSRLGRMIRKTSRFINKTTTLNPSIPGLKIGHLEIALR